ncbi:MAG: 23S rRNA (uracil(1939)-C(5))-methyltransferase RlmD [Christensenellales bacterium]
MSNFRRPKHLTTRRMQETRPNPPKEHSTSPRPAREIRWNCPAAAKCGGCQLTRLSYAEQLQWKQQRVAELLDGICEVRPILGMDDPFHYRNKVHAVLAVDKAGKPISGVYAMGTHRVVPVRHCLIEDRRADRIIQTIVAMLPAYKLRIYNEYTHRGFLRHILIRTGHVTGQIMVVLVATSLEFPGKKAFVQELIQCHPEITTVVLNCNQRETSMVLGTKEITLYGEGYMEDELCGKRFRISPQSFYQVNAKQCELLYRTAIDAAHLTGAETLLDAYCGTGTIGLCASDGCKQLIGVELNADAIRDAKENARRNGVENARFLCDDAGRFMQKLAKEGNAPDVVMMDPPRAGSDQKFLQSLLMLKPKRVVYVSCNPETLARDLRVLVDGGYRAEWATPVDMFPGTEHVETVVLLSHKKADSYIHIDVEFGEGEGKIPVDSIAKRAEAYKPKEKVTYKMIKEYIEAKYGFKVHTAYIAEVKRNLGLPMYDAPNAVEELKQPRKHPTPEKIEAIKDALRYFAVI